MKTNYTKLILSLSIFLFAKGSLKAQCTSTTVPYYEGFTTITANNQLPNCWTASNLGSNCLTFNATNQYAAFYYSPSGVNYFYSRGIQLYTGVNYSVCMFYRTTSPGNSNWTNLSILVGTNQNPTGLVQVAGVGPA